MGGSTRESEVSDRDEDNCMHEGMLKVRGESKAKRNREPLSGKEGGGRDRGSVAAKAGGGGERN